MITTPKTPLAVCLDLARAIGGTRTVHEIYTAALDALASGLAVSRSSILLFDDAGVMRFVASRRLSRRYRAAVEGHSPWRPDTPNPEPVVVADVRLEPALRALLPAVLDEGIGAMAFIPLVSQARVIGKFMLYYDSPRTFTADELELAALVAAHVAFAVERTRTEAQARRSEERLRFALDAASMGTWDWDPTTQAVHWSENLEAIHGVPAGTFDGTFASYEREIHPDDRAAVLASARRAIEYGTPHAVEYRVRRADGSIAWVEGKGRVEYENGRPARMSGVCMSVTQRKEAELQRLAAAEDASRLKDEFLAILSHELRTPLHAILGWVQMLEAGAIPAERLRQAIEVIGRNARLQSRLIEDILDVSRIITGKLEIERVPIGLPGLVDTVVSGAAPAAHARRITLRKRLPSVLPDVLGDPKRLHQVLANIVSNAVKFTGEGGHVDIDGGATPDGVELRVRDTGAGIDPAFLPHVFDRFRQADSRSTRQHGGLGLGLTIARHLVEQHGGAIRAESAGRGHGATFTVTLPAALTPPPADPPEPALRAAAAPLLRIDGTRVLIVDDDADSRDMLASLVEACGAHAVPCASAAAALAALASGDIDLLIADIAMPGMDGYELIRRARAGRSRIPAVAVSAYAHPQDQSRALDAGFTACCPKPVDVTALLATIRISLTS